MKRNAHTPEQTARIAREHFNTEVAYERGQCPMCGRGVRRNWSITGWIQCEQFGAVGFRADGSMPSCSWQGFTSESVRREHGKWARAIVKHVDALHAAVVRS